MAHLANFGYNEQRMKTFVASYPIVFYRKCDGLKASTSSAAQIGSIDYLIQK